jgi:hypothetical protein
LRVASRRADTMPARGRATRCARFCVSKLSLEPKNIWHDGLGVRKTAVEGYPRTRVWEQPPAMAHTFYAKHGFGGSPVSVERAPNTGLGRTSNRV